MRKANKGWGNNTSFYKETITTELCSLLQANPCGKICLLIPTVRELEQIPGTPIDC